MMANQKIKAKNIYRYSSSMLSLLSVGVNRKLVRIVLHDEVERIPLR